MINTIRILSLASSRMGRSFDPFDFAYGSIAKGSPRRRRVNQGFVEVAATAGASGNV